MQPDRENQAIKKSCGVRYNVEMTIGDRIKGTCVKSGAWHGFLGWNAVGTPRLTSALVGYNTKGRVKSDVPRRVSCLNDAIFLSWRSKSTKAVLIFPR